MKQQYPSWQGETMLEEILGAEGFGTKLLGDNYLGVWMTITWHKKMIASKDMRSQVEVGVN
ncbi:hypothetical protein Pse7367_3194 [Thalassoporum mexicanum PCC 7367]|uniref:hypothetical protein n=1 Tax=Thalassoporum mexicanum TaxID=3457544 RepID=UPI00029FDF1D|nr:hypothetical protein [Pseudanabaena sp. PCC 7367]AFY71442.1 hypothetical protein Pse7367_3194 [Pseudanabaena sp. PCC 7367]